MKNYFSLIKLGLSFLVISTLVPGCSGKPNTLSNADPIAPLFHAQYISDTAVATLKKSYNPSDIEYKDGRNLYNHAASSINALIMQVIVSIEANSAVNQPERINGQIKLAINEASEFQEFVDTKTFGPDFQSGADIPINPLDFPKIIEVISGAINTYTAAARAADSRQRATIICELKALLLKPFDEVGETKSNPVTDCYSNLIEKSAQPTSNSESSE